MMADSYMPKLGKRGPYKKRQTEIDMEFISKAIDRLPPWAKLIFWVFVVIVIVYSIAKEGFWTILLKAIFSP